METNVDSDDNLPVVPPAGVMIMPLPDGRTQIVLPPPQTRKAVEELALGVVVFGGLLALGSGRAVLSFLRRNDRTALLLMGIFVIGLAGYLLAQFLLKTVGKVEWTAGPDSLEITHTLLGLRWKKRYAGATLQMQMIQRSVYVSAALTLHKGGQKHFLTDFEQADRTAWAEQLGALLAQITGWPFEA